MAFLRFANATVIHPHIGKSDWGKVRTSSRKAKQDIQENLVTRAASLFGKPFDPNDFLMTHATIIASVDTYDPGSPTGSFLLDGFKGNRKFADFRVEPECDKYINNNLDCWNRPVLLKAYPTFIGGHNFVEHVQVEDLSRGRIIDAVCRDIGDSVYTDILIATDRKHRDLIKAIEDHKMSTLSMGCTVDGTICTKCGHWAADETELCPHIKYEKGNSFFDEQGRRHRVAELCGHQSLDPHGGVQFIEASWVGTPAFTGAVLRNILVPGADLAKKAQAILTSPPPQWSSDARLLAASVTPKGDVVVARMPTPNPGVRVGQSGDPRLVMSDDSISDVFLAGWADDAAVDAEPSAEEAPEAPKAPEDPMKGLEDEMVKVVRDRVQKRLKEELNPTPPRQTPEQSSIGTNSNIVKDAKLRYTLGLDAIVRTASNDADLIDRIASYNDLNGIKIPVPIYRVSLKVGSSDQYRSVEAFWKACETALGRSPTLPEARTLLRLGKLLAHGKSASKNLKIGSRQGGPT